ncbi:hypothetical protein ACM26V_13375 [Salipaludibacillus sp. HK11]|uniref:hypothetical protein n=1 Tax=Salipaludibacillus sp. HK11 TaxID=3394320 RepID=UPI0039FD2789
MDSNFLITIYKYIKASMLYWLYLLRGLVVYSLIPSSCAILLLIKDIEKKNDETDDGEEISIKQLFKSHYERYTHLKFPSFIFTNVLLVMFACLYLVNLSEGSWALLISIILIYLIALTLAVLTYTIHFLVKVKEPFMRIIAYSFTASVKNIIISLGLLVVLAVLYYVGTINLVLFIVTFPFIYAYAIKSLLNNVGIPNLPKTE